MATDVDQSCYEWPCEELTDQDDSVEISVSQMLDHGSISFGRFALEPLSWEKRSVFTHNRYQEELEKLRAPGLVAQKKAYFEEYYKRIRAMKALQENQHTEPASCCGYSRDISTEIMEENQRIVPTECYEDVMVKTIGPCTEETSNKINLYVDGETESMDHDSPVNFLSDDKLCESFPNSRLCQILDKNFDNLVPMMRSIEDSVQHVSERLDNKQKPCAVRLEGILQLTRIENQRIVEKESHGDEFESSIGSGREKASPEVLFGIGLETELLETDPITNLSEVDQRAENSRNRQFQPWDQMTPYHEPTAASIEDSKQLDFISQKKEEILKKSEKYVPKGSVYLAGSPKILELKLNKEQKKVNQTVKAHKGCVFTPEAMEHSSSTEDFIKSEHKIKSRTVFNQALRDSSLKRNSQIKACFFSPNQTVDRILSYKHASVTSSGSHREVHSKVTARPFSFTGGKRGISSTSVSPRFDRKNISSSPQLPPSNIISKDVSRRLGASYCFQSEKLETKSGREGLGKKPFTPNRQSANLTGGNANSVMRPLKARSVNLPTYRGTNIGSNSDKLGSNNEDGKLKLAEVMVSPTIRDLTPKTKNSPHGVNSLSRRKLRQEKPRWR